MVRDLFPESIMPVVHGVIVSYSTKGTDEGPSVELQRAAAGLIKEKLQKLTERYPQYKNVKLDTEVQVCYALGAASPTLSGPDGENVRGEFADANIIIAPNLDLGNFLYHSYAKSYPGSIKLTQMGGVRHKIVEFARESRWEEVVLGIKANILRMWKHGKWQATPRDYFFKRYKILAINPGSTSTKISLYEGERNLFTEELSHPHEKLAAYGRLTEQYRFRKETILEELKKKGFRIGQDKLDAVVARGGLLWPMEGGVYALNGTLLSDLKEGVQGDHASNLGGLIAKDLGDELKLPSFIVDPPVVDEVDDILRITGMKEIRRKVISHALSQIATAKRYAEENGVFYSELNLIVAHLGGGISIGAHYRGRYIDVNNALTGEGPFSPERSGSLPPGQLIDLCFSGKFTHQEMKLKNKGKGGLISLIGTADFIEVEKRYKGGDAEAVTAVQAMAYQIAKEISSLVPAFCGEKVDQVLMTGGLAKSDLLMGLIRGRLPGLGVGITLYPGQNEMQALAGGALRALQGKEKVREYAGKRYPVFPGGDASFRPPILRLFRKERNLPFRGGRFLCPVECSGKEPQGLRKLFQEVP
jgi:butyrate kinase